MTNNDPNRQEEQENNATPLSQQLLSDINTAASGAILQTSDLKTSWNAFRSALDPTDSSGYFTALQTEMRAEYNGQAWIDNLCATWIDADSESVQIEFARLAAIRLLGAIAGNDATYASTVFDRLWAVAADEDDKYSGDARAWALISLQTCNLEVDVERWQATFGAPIAVDDIDEPACWIKSVVEANVRAKAVRALGIFAQNAACARCWHDPGSAECAQQLTQCRFTTDLFENVEQMLLTHWDYEIDYGVIFEMVKALGYIAGWGQLPLSIEAGWGLYEVVNQAAHTLNLDIRKQVPIMIGHVATNIMHRRDVTPNQMRVALTILINLAKMQIKALQQDSPEDRAGNIYELQRRYVLTMSRMARTALDDLPKPQDEEIVSLAVEGLLATVDTLLDTGTVKIRSLALFLIDELARSDNHARHIITENALADLKLMLADSHPEIAKVAARTIVTLIQDKAASKFLVEVILDDTLLEAAIAKRGSNGVLAAEGSSDRLQQELRQRAAETLGSIPDNGEAHDELVKTLRSDVLRSGRARDALIVMGGERAVESIVNYNLQQQVSDKFFNPMEEARKKGWEMLEDVRNWADSNYKYALYAAIATMAFGIVTFIIGILILLLDQTESFQTEAAITFLTGPLLVFVGAVGAYLWEPAKGLNKMASELSRLIMSFENYLGRMRLIGLGFAHAYTQNSFDQLQFLTRISEITAAAMRESAVSLEDIGAWPDFAVEEKFVAVPALVGQPLKNARRLVEQAKLEIEVGVPQYDQHCSPGTLIKQEPAAGMFVAKNTRIKVIPCTNQLPNVEVPNFKGKTILATVDLAQQSGLKLEEIMFAFHPDAAEGHVIKQDLRPGLNVSQGTYIMLTVAKKADVLEAEDM